MKMKLNGMNLLDMVEQSKGVFEDLRELLIEQDKRISAIEARLGMEKTDGE